MPPKVVLKYLAHRKSEPHPQSVSSNNNSNTSLKPYQIVVHDNNTKEGNLETLTVENDDKISNDGFDNSCPLMSLLIVKDRNTSFQDSKSANDAKNGKSKTLKTTLLSHIISINAYSPPLAIVTKPEIGKKN